MYIAGQLYSSSMFVTQPAALQGCRGGWVRGHRGRRVQGCQGRGVQRGAGGVEEQLCRGIGVQGYRGAGETGVCGYSGTGILVRRWLISQLARMLTQAYACVQTDEPLECATVQVGSCCNVTGCKKNTFSTSAMSLATTAEHIHTCKCT